jgi:hypothetical protein
MEQIFSYQFQSESIAWLIFGGLTFVGVGLGYMFRLDFRKRFSKRGNLAGLMVLVAGSLLGVVLGYRAAQPAYFKKLTASTDGIRLEYYPLTADVLLPWNDIESISLQQNRLSIRGRQGVDYRSPVVYRGDQERLLQSLAR